MAFSSIRIALSAAVAALVLALAAPAAAQKATPAPRTPPAMVPPEEPAPPYPPLTGADAEAVRDVVRQYQDAIRRGDGTAAARLVTRETREYYARMLEMAVSATEQEVRAASLMDRMMILMYRHRVPAAELRALPSDAAFAHTIDAGWVTATEGEELAARSEAYGQGDRAALRYRGDTHFLREDGGWRWDMMPLIRGASAEFAEGLDSREEEDEFLMFVLKQSNGRDPSPAIWQPLP